MDFGGEPADMAVKPNLSWFPRHLPPLRLEHWMIHWVLGRKEEDEWKGWRSQTREAGFVLLYSGLKTPNPANPFSSLTLAKKRSPAPCMQAKYI
jgi:hypothetical protein